MKLLFSIYSKSNAINIILRIQIVALRNIFINQYKIFLSDFITKQASCKTCVIDLYFIA